MVTKNFQCDSLKEGSKIPRKTFFVWWKPNFEKTMILYMTIPIHNSLIRIGYLKNIHFLFACNYLSLEKMIGNLIVDWTRRSKKKDVMVTLLTMTRLNLVTKELMMEIIQNRG